MLLSVSAAAAENSGCMTCRTCTLFTVLVFGEWEEVTSKCVCTCRRLLSNSLSLCEIPQLASLYVPMDASSHSAVGSHSSSFQTAALLAAAVDTMTLPLRCSGTHPCSMHHAQTANIMASCCLLDTRAVCCQQGARAVAAKPDLAVRTCH
jgi:hypothetical protein